MFLSLSFEAVSLWPLSVGWPGTHCVVLAVWGDPPASASWVLGPGACSTSPARTLVLRLAVQALGRFPRAPANFIASLHRVVSWCTLDSVPSSLGADLLALRPFPSPSSVLLGHRRPAHSSWAPSTAVLCHASSLGGRRSCPAADASRGHHRSLVSQGFVSIHCSAPVKVLW